MIIKLQRAALTLDLLIQERKLRTNLPRSVSRCHGNCGQNILPEQEGMLIKSFVTTTWTDGETGAEKSKFGQPYIHYDSDKYCKPGDCFNRGRISVNSVTAGLSSEHIEKIF